MPFEYKTGLHYTESGGGNLTLIFLHFFGGSADSWEKVISLLRDSFHCISVDLYGFGNSPGPDTGLSVNQTAAFVLEFITQLKLGRYVLIGHSMGGKIAMAAASVRPAGLQSLILVAPSPPTPEPTSEKDRRQFIEAYGKPLSVREIVQKIIYAPLSEDETGQIINDHLRVSRIAWDSWLQSGSREDISSAMPGINTPVLVVSGSNDPNFSTVFLQQTFRKLLPQARFMEIQGSGHLIPIEKPEPAANLIIQSLM